MSGHQKRTLLSICSCLQSLEESADPGIDQILVAELKHIVLKRIAEIESLQAHAAAHPPGYEAS